MVIIDNKQFNPSPLTIYTGDSVTWKNDQSLINSATADNGSWDTGNIFQWEEETLWFYSPGEYPYYSYCASLAFWCEPYWGTLIVETRPGETCETCAADCCQ